MSTVASPTATHAHAPHPSHGRLAPAPQAAAPETPFSALMDATANDAVPPSQPAAKPAAPPSSAKDAKDTKNAAKDAAHDQDSPADAANSAPSDATTGDTAPTAPATTGTAIQDAKDAAKASVATGTPDPAGDAPDPAAKSDGDTDTTAAATAVTTAATATIPTPVAAAIVLPTPQSTTPAPSETAPDVAAIAGAAAAAGTAQTAATQAVADAASIGAVGVATVGQGGSTQKPGKPLPTAQALATDAAQTADADPNASTPGLAVATGATGKGDANGVTGTEPHPLAPTAKSTTPEKDVATDRAASPASAQPDKPAGLPTDTPAQPGPAALGPDQAAPVAPQPLPVSATADPSAANTAAAAAVQTTAAMAAVPVAGVAVEIAARAQSGTNRFSIRLDPPELGRIDVRLDVDKQGNVTSHLVVERSATLDMLRRDAPQLERALQDAGLKTGGDGLQFSLRDQGAGAQNQSFQDNSSARSARVIIPTDDVTPVDTARNYGRLYGQSGGLDIRV